MIDNPKLGERLREMTKVLLTHQKIAAVDIFGDLDAMKVRSCMTLFDAVSPDDIFEQVLENSITERAARKHSIICNVMI